MYRNPLFGYLTGRQPKPEPKEVAYDGVQLQRSMRFGQETVNGSLSNLRVINGTRIDNVAEPAVGGKAHIVELNFIETALSRLHSQRNIIIPDSFMKSL